MKVLLFTHGQDIDGIGSILLGKKAFEKLDYIPCDTFEITKKVEEKIKDKSIYQYDLVFVTDLCIKEPLLSQINKDLDLKNKILVLDHHKSEIEEGNNKYEFVHIIVENESGKTSGTYLFYQYLIENNFLEKTKILDEFVEYTRQYDTWEWYTKYKNNEARKLHILMEELGYKKYLNIMEPILETNSKIIFSNEIEEIITNFDTVLNKELNGILNNIKIYSEEIDKIKYKIGFITIPYKYRNEFAEIITKNNIYDIDAIGMIMTNKDTVSYRKIKDVDVSKIAVYFGGKGHKSAATNPQNNQKFVKVLKKLTKE